MSDNTKLRPEYFMYQVQFNDYSLKNIAIAYGVYNLMKTTKETRDLVVYMALGDGYINKAGYLSMRHCLKQEDYIWWKYKLLKGKVSVVEQYYVSNNGYGSYEIRTHNTRFIKLYRNIIYRRNGKKDIANRKLLNKLTPLGLAIWYMDDGGLSQKKDKNGNIKANDLMINTHLSKEDNQVIIDYFSEVWDINFTQVKNRGHYRLRCGTREARKFIKIVLPYVSQVPSMAHKVNVKT